MEFLRKSLFGIKAMCLVIVLLTCQQGDSQASFTHASHMFQNPDIGSSIAIGVADINGDYRDDLVRLIKGTDFTVDYQVAHSDKLINRHIADTGGDGQWMMLIGDLNNDYQNEFLVAGFYNGASIYSNEGGTGNFVKQQTTSVNFFAQGGNFTDIDNDGYVDFFVCNDDALSKIYMNDGTGFLVEQSDLIDMNSIPASDNSGNYASMFMDIDDDGDQDLFIVKCRISVEDPEDGRRINVLYINENGNFTEQGEAFGLRSGVQSWSVDFGDIDNDGDLDCFIGNHFDHHVLMENIDNTHFVEIENFVDGENVTDLIIQGSFMDFDNDGFQDILVAGDLNYLLHNNGDKSFSRINNPFGASNAGSYALGDLNSDGFVDAVVTYGSVLGAGAGVEDQLYLNNGNDNHFISLSLRGVESNSSGIGAKVEIYGPWGLQIRHVTSGVSYGIVNSLTQRFGLGASETIEKIKIRWPSGTIDEYTDLDADQFLVATEGQCLTALVNLELDGFTLLCPGDQAVISSGGEEINWSTGESSTEQVVTSSGFYNGSFSTDNCLSFTETIYFGDPSESIPEISIDADKELCIGDVLTVEARETNGMIWSNGTQGPIAEYFEEGPVYLTIENNCGMINSDTFYISIANPTLEPYEETILEETTIELFAEGDSVTWSDDDLGMNVIATGNSFTTGIIEKDTVFYAKRSELLNTKLYDGGEQLERLIPDNKFSSDAVNGGLYFKVLKPCIIESVKIETDKAGPRKIQIISGFDPVFEKIVEFDSAGVYTVELNAQLDPFAFDYLMTTEQQFNILNLGHAGCRFARLDTDINFPYHISDLVSINNSEFGPIYYHHYFEWKVKEDVGACESFPVPYAITTDFTDSVIEVDQLEGVDVYPNPFQNTLSIVSEESLDLIQVFDINGKVVFEATKTDKMKFDTGHLESGAYIMRIANQAEVATKKIIKQ